MFFMQIMEAFLVRTDPALKHGEAGAHPHDEGAPNEEGEGVEDEGGLVLDAQGVRDAGPEEHEQDSGDAGRGEDDGDTVAGHDPMQWLHSDTPPLQHHAQPGQPAESTIAEPQRASRFPCALYRGWVNGYYRRGIHG